jgi:hypothetical protein
MGVVPPIVQEFRADPDHLIRFARIVAKHFTALADDLEQLRPSESPHITNNVTVNGGTGDLAKDVADGLRRGMNAAATTRPSRR